MKKKGIMQLPFGVIFGIILIAIFIAVAFFAISKFLNLQKCGEIGNFYNDLESQIHSSLSAQLVKNVSFKIKLPSSIEYICFVDINKSLGGKYIEMYNDAEIYREEFNLFLYPPEKACDLESRNIEKINISSITDKQNPYCIKNKNNPEIILNKGFKDAVVKINLKR